MDFNNLLSEVIIKSLLIESLLTNTALGSQAHDGKLQGQGRQASALNLVSSGQTADCVQQSFLLPLTL